MTSNHAEKTVRLTVAQAVVKYLQSQYSERDGEVRRFIPAMFGIFGHGNVAGMGQALYECGGELPFYHSWNEQSMVHTAAGFAKANLRLATLACTASIGPGSTNMVTGAALATINRLPVLLFPSDYYVTRRQGPVLQQLEHCISADASVNDCFRPVSRFFDRITRPEHLLSALPEALRVLTDPCETGAAVISLPQDIQAYAYDYPVRFFEKRVWRVERRVADPQRINEAINLIKGAQRPFIIAGGGVHYSQAWDELKNFSESLGIPVGETFAGRGAIRNDSSLLLGGVGATGTPSAAKLASQADLVLCVGTRLTDFTTGSQSLFQHPQVKFASINVCGHDAFKQGALPIIADAKRALTALLDQAASAGVRPNTAYVQEVASAGAAWQKRLQEEVCMQVPGERMSQGQVIGVLNKESRPGDTVVAAAGTPPSDLHQQWDSTRGCACHLEFGFSCMGYELPASLGVRLAQPAGEVYTLVGDGTYLLNPTELITAVQEGLKITVVLPENNGYQSIRRLQMGRAGRSFGNEFRYRDPETHRLEGDYLEVDLAKHAESMGARTWSVSTPDELRQALRDARTEARSCVIVAKIERQRYQPDSEVWWDVAPAEATNDPLTRELRGQYEQDRERLQRFFY